MDVSTLRPAVDSGRDLIRFSMRAQTVHQLPQLQYLNLNLFSQSSGSLAAKGELILCNATMRASGPRQSHFDL